jgi:hypothetical protein
MDDKLPSSPYNASAAPGNIVFNATLCVFNASAEALPRTIPLFAGTSAPVAAEGDYMTAAAALPRSAVRHALIIAPRLVRPDGRTRRTHI